MLRMLLSPAALFFAPLYDQSEIAWDEYRINKKDNQERCMRGMDSIPSGRREETSQSHALVCPECTPSSK